MRLTDFRALSFDCYGTLIDWESGLAAALEPLARRAGRAVDGAVLASFGKLETSVQGEDPALLYPQVLAEVHRRLAEGWQVEADRDEAEAFARSIGDWPAFPDSPEALAYLQRAFRLIILSNVD